MLIMCPEFQHTPASTAQATCGWVGTPAISAEVDSGDEGRASGGSKKEGTGWAAMSDRWWDQWSVVILVAGKTMAMMGSTLIGGDFGGDSNNNDRRSITTAAMAMTPGLWPPVANNGDNCDSGLRPPVANNKRIPLMTTVSSACSSESSGII